MEITVNLDTKIKKIHELQKKAILKANPEYQRSLVWSPHQKKMFIDSLLRGYSAPAFYFHKIKVHVSGDEYNTTIDIIDGQQRVNAIVEYIEGGFALLDPKDKNSFRFPNFVKDMESPWAGKRFENLDEELQKELLDHKIVSYEITTEDENEIRDLFIRLQAGTPLSPQDKRDAWPGKFTEFVLLAGGKSGVDKYYGWEFFKRNTKTPKESRRRELIAQTYMLFHSTREDKRFCDLKSSNIDQFYHNHIDFDSKSKNCKDFKSICDTLHSEMQGHPKLDGHHTIHLILLLDALKRDYPSGWKGKIADTLGEFKKRCIEARKANKAGDDNHEYRYYYARYLQWTGTSSNTESTIRDRHVFFTQEMVKLLDINPKDTQRVFNATERETIFYRDRGKCQYCAMQGEDRSVAWEDVEIHHILPHSKGGKTEINNGALVHKDYHPKAKNDVDKFREWWQDKKTPIKKHIFSPDRTLSSSKPQRKSYNGARMTVHEECLRLLFQVKGIDAKGDHIGLSYDEVIEQLRDIFPQGQTKEASLRWYETKVRNGTHQSTNEKLERLNLHPEDLPNRNAKYY